MSQPVSPDDHDNKHHHIIPVSLLAKVFGALVFLTILTALTAQVDLGALNVPLALAIACTKAGLVVMVFMGLRYDNRVNTLVFSIGAIFVIIFLGFTLLDTTFRGDLGNVSKESTFEQERQAERVQSRLDSLSNAATETEAGTARGGGAATGAAAASSAPADSSAAPE